MATLDELESAEATAWWRRDAAERHAAAGEQPDDGEEQTGLDERQFRQLFAHLVRSTGTVTHLSPLGLVPTMTDAPVGPFCSVAVAVGGCPLIALFRTLAAMTTKERLHVWWTT